MSTDAQSGELHLSLPSSFVSLRHARFLRSDGSWIIEAVGTNPIYRNGNELDSRKKQKIDVGDQLDFGEFTLSILIDEQAPQTVSTLETPAVVLGAIEQSVHGALLDAMDLRRARKTINLEAPELQAQLLSHLADIIARAMQNLAPEQISVLGRAALASLVLYRITAAGGVVLESRSGTLAWRPVGAIVRRQIEGTCDRLVAQLGLELNLRSFRDDLEKVDAHYGAVARTIELELGPTGFRDVLALHLRRASLDIIFGLGPLQDLMEMEAVSEVMVVARDTIFIEKGGVVVNVRRAFASDDALLAVIERIVAPIGRRIDKSSPMVDAHLEDGSRVNAVVPPLALKGPCLTIRKFRKSPLTIDDLVGFGALSMSMRDFLSSCVRGRKNIVVSGGTGSGKTTLLNCLSAFISPDERVVTVEDTAELQLRQQHVVTLESRPANMEGKGAISIRDLVRNSLRMRPDRVIVGECRGPEAIDMLQAMNTGHDGSMTTAHANNPEDMIRRLETMVLMAVDMPIAAIREQIASAVEIIVQVQRLADGRRRVTHIAEVVDVDRATSEVIVENIFATSRDGDRSDAKYTGYLPTFAASLLAQGHLDLGVLFREMN